MNRSKLIKYLLIVIFVTFCGSSYGESEIEKNTLLQDSISKLSDVQMMDKAASFYSDGYYEEAAKVYSSLLEKGKAFILYYNLGNAMYKSGNIPEAILNYERALKIEPKNEDALFNLRLCNIKIVDKVELLNKFFFSKWFYSFQKIFNSNHWAIISLISFIIFIISLFVYFFIRNISMRKVGFFTGIITLLISVFSLIYSCNQYQDFVSSDEAIIFTPSVIVKSSPDKSGTELFVIHEGLKVKVKDKVGGWYEIKLTDGNIGWIKETDLKII